MTSSVRRASADGMSLTLRIVRPQMEECALVPETSTPASHRPCPGCIPEVPSSGSFSLLLSCQCLSTPSNVARRVRSDSISPNVAETARLISLLGTRSWIFRLLFFKCSIIAGRASRDTTMSFLPALRQAAPIALTSFRRSKRSSGLSPDLTTCHSDSALRRPG